MVAASASETQASLIPSKISRFTALFSLCLNPSPTSSCTVTLATQLANGWLSRNLLSSLSLSLSLPLNMGQLKPDPSPSYFQQASEPQPQEYHYEQQATDEIPPPGYEPYNDESSYPPQETNPQQQPPQQYPPQTPPRTYPPQSAGKPQTYPPQAEQAAAVQFPPPRSEKAYEPSEPAAVQFPPPQQGYNAPGPAVQFPPRSPFSGAQQLQMGARMNYVGMGAQPASGVPVMNNEFPKIGTEGWSTDLFGCMENPENALITAIFPCVTFGQIAEIVDNGHTSCGTSGMLYGCIAFLIAIPCLISCTYRTKMRSKFGLVEAPAPDWAVHCLCECCALCQEFRELQHRGYDPSIGWMGNVAMQQQQQQIGMVPPMNQTMMG